MICAPSKQMANTQQVTDLLQQWSDVATEQALTHDTARARLRAGNLAASSIAVAMAVISGAGNFSAFGDKRFLAFGALGILSGVVVALQRYLGLPEKQQSHAHAADDFTQLASDIQAHQTATRAFSVDGVPAEIAPLRARLDRLLDITPSHTPTTSHYKPAAAAPIAPVAQEEP